MIRTDPGNNRFHIQSASRLLLPPDVRKRTGYDVTDFKRSARTRVRTRKEAWAWIDAQNALDRWLSTLVSGYRPDRSGGT